MGEQSGARIGGDNYQHLFSWYLLLILLDPVSDYEYAYVEHPKAGAADDVTLHPKVRKTAPARYYQIKWHVSASEHYGFEVLAAVKKPSTTSLIEKLFQSWKDLAAAGSAEIWLVSNWPAATDFGRFIHDDYGFNEIFHSCGKNSKGGKGRRLWQKTLKATDEEISDFCRDLRLRLGFAGTRDLEEIVDERMSNNGMKSGSGPRDIAIGALRRLIKAGGERKKITRDSLIQLITESNLWAQAVDKPKVSLEIHGWIKRRFEENPTIEMDWTRYFDRDTRGIPDQNIWESELLPELVKARKQLQETEHGHYIDFRGKLSLTAVLAIGAAFPEVAGFAFRAEQPTDTEINLWRSDTPPTGLKFDRFPDAENTDRGDLLISLSVSGNGLSDAKPFYDKNREKFSALVYAEPATGTGSSAIKTAGDAVALANDAKVLIREYRTLYGGKDVHLILYAPATFCLFLGQKLNAVGRLITYERTADGGYRESLVVNTG